MARLIPASKQGKGSAAPDARGPRHAVDFVPERIRRPGTKPKIGAWGLNFQNCAHVVTFATHSYEAHYQAVTAVMAVPGQARAVTLDLVTTER